MIETGLTATVHLDPGCRAAVEATIPTVRFRRPEEVSQAIPRPLAEAAACVSGAILDVAGGGPVIPA